MLAETEPQPYISPTPEQPEQSIPLNIIDSSAISTFRACRKKFYWTNVRRIKPQGVSLHLVAGGAFAAGIESARIAQFAFHQKEPLSLDALCNAAMPAFLKAWGNNPIFEDQAKNFHNTFHALERYMEEFPPYHDSVQPYILPDGMPATEFTFAIPLPIMAPNNEPYIFCGKFDLLGKMGDLLVVQDEKTTGSLNSTWITQWDLRGQFIGYVWACRQLGYPVDHCIVRGIAIQKTQHQFAVVPIQYSDHLINRWYEELLRTCLDINSCYEKNHWSYNFGDACSSYGGCSYAELCRAYDPEPFLVNYESNNWSPIEHD